MKKRWESTVKFKRLVESSLLDFNAFSELDDKGDDKGLEEMIAPLKKEFKNPKFFEENKDLIIDSILEFKGHADPNVNKFLDLLIHLEANNDYLDLMSNLYESGEINLSKFDGNKPYYNWASLNSFYTENSEKDIKYKARIFDIVSNPEKLKRFFSDISHINIKDLYLDEDNVKEASLNDPDNKEGMYYQVSIWDNNNTKKKREKSGKERLEDEIKKLENELSGLLKNPTKYIEAETKLKELRDELHNLK